MLSFKITLGVQVSRTMIKWNSSESLILVWKTIKKLYFFKHYFRKSDYLEKVCVVRLRGLIRGWSISINKGRSTQKSTTQPKLKKETFGYLRCDRGNNMVPKQTVEMSRLEKCFLKRIEFSVALWTFYAKAGKISFVSPKTEKRF